MGFERCHPMINLIYFTVVVTGMLVFQHPVFLLISFLSAFVYSIKRNHIRAWIFNLILLPLVAAFALYYGSYTHFGVTILEKNAIGNNITLESLIYGMVLGIQAAGLCIWFSCIYSVFSADKVVYLFGKLSPRLSLFLAILLRMVPRIKTKAHQIHTAQKGIGKGMGHGNIFRRIRNCIRIFSILITWTIEALPIISESMRSRGSSLRGRTAFSIYRFDDRDRAYGILLSTCITITMMAVLLKQTNMQYNPRIVLPVITPVSWLFFCGYTILCLMPLALELWTQYRFQRARRHL